MSFYVPNKDVGNKEATEDWRSKLNALPWLCKDDRTSI
jgi:hypothetical protein